MSALDEALKMLDVLVADGVRIVPIVDGARAELALLRRCREAVVGLVGSMARTDGQPWWLDEYDDYGAKAPGCVVCGYRDHGRGPVDLAHHAPDCPALAIDALAREVRGE